MFFDTNYLLLVMIPSILLSLGAQFFVMSAYSKWGKTSNSAGLTGYEFGERIKRSGGLTAVQFEGVPGQLSDHFDPRDNIVRLSQDVATKPSVASMAIIAHELGHAQQYQEKSLLISMRSFLVPAMQFSPTVAYGLIFAGFIFNATSLIWAGIAFFAVVVGFMLLTLPVEIDASRRGMKLLQQTGIMSSQDASGARQMLTAAALTYVAAFVSSLLTLLYYVSIASRD